MPSNGTGHRKTKKHKVLNRENHLRHRGDVPISLSELKEALTTKKG